MKKKKRKATEERNKTERKAMREQKKMIKNQTMKIKHKKEKLGKPNNVEKRSHQKNVMELGLKNVDKIPSSDNILKGKKQCINDTKLSFGLCYTCGTNFKNEENENPIECDMCDRVYHMKCARASLDNIMIDEKDPVFICKLCEEFGNEIANGLQLS